MTSVADIERRLQDLGTADRAENEARYLKSDLVHLGVRVPDIRQVARGVLGETPASRDATVELAGDLWARPVHELRMASVEVLCARHRQLLPEDLGWIEGWLRECRTWALLDPLAITVCGSIVERFPESASVLDRWATDADFWVRRAALLALLGALRRGEGDFARFGRYADQMLDETEFFIRKAIGWVLRETSKRRPELVTGWVAERTHRLSGVSIREAVKYLPDRERLLAAYRDRRPAE